MVDRTCSASTRPADSLKETYSLVVAGTAARTRARASSNSSIGNTGRAPVLLMGRRQHEHLFQRGHAIAGTVQRRHAQRPHALANGDLAHLASVGAGDDELADLIRYGHGLDNGHAPGIAGVLAAVATPPAVQRDAVDDARIDAQILKHLLRIGNRFLAMRADAAHETLRAGEDDRRGNEEGSDAHIVEPRDGARGVITVHGA